MALARHVSLLDYADHRGPSAPQPDGCLPRSWANGQVTEDTLPGSTVGPFISQFLLQDVPYGAQTVSQRIRTPVAGDDRVSIFAEWLRLVSLSTLPALFRCSFRQRFDGKPTNRLLIQVQQRVDHCGTTLLQ